MEWIRIKIVARTISHSELRTHQLINHFIGCGWILLLKINYVDNSRLDLIRKQCSKVGEAHLMVTLLNPRLLFGVRCSVGTKANFYFLAL